MSTVCHIYRSPKGNLLKKKTGLFIQVSESFWKKEKIMSKLCKITSHPKYQKKKKPEKTSKKPIFQRWET